MKALVQKELRENTKVAVLGLIIFGLGLLHQYLDYVGDLKEIALGAGMRRGGVNWQPLVEGGFVMGIAYLCPILAAVLGWFQIHNERHRDLWSFLVHRPMTRTQIFLGKAGAGLALYFLGAGLPLLLFIGWAVIPGHVAAPLEWPMLLPAIAMFLTGPAYCFAGMLTGLRQVRWYASRGVPLASGIVVSICAAIVLHFWQALLVDAAGAAVLGLAAWGCFHSNGGYEGQPKAAKPGLALGLALGTTVIVLFGAALVTEVFLRSWLTAPRTWHRYGMLNDGTIYKQIDSDNRPAERLDLNGKPLTNKKTGRPRNPQETQLTSPSSVSVSVHFGEPERPPGYLRQADGLFAYEETTPGVLWFYWARYARVVAFDVRSRLAIGSLGPDGFVQGALGGAPFDYPPKSLPENLNPLKTATTLYRLHLARRTATAIFTTTTNDPIGGGSFSAEPVKESYWTAVATRHFIYLLTSPGEPIWKSPYEPHYPDYDHASIYFLQPTNTCALWFYPSGGAQRRAGGTLPDHVTFLADGQSTRAVDLPNQPQPYVFDAADRVMSFLAPPLLVAMDECLPQDMVPRVPIEVLWFSLAGAGLCIAAGWWLGRRYALGLPAQAGWAVFLLFFGIPGLLAFLGLQEWPAREACPDCGRLRVVNREHCEHCGAVFRPAAPTGTEIFETAA